MTMIQMTPPRTLAPPRPRCSECDRDSVVHCVYPVQNPLNDEEDFRACGIFLCLNHGTRRTMSDAYCKEHNAMLSKTIEQFLHDLESESITVKISKDGTGLSILPRATSADVVALVKANKPNIMAYLSPPPAVVDLRRPATATAMPAREIKELFAPEPLTEKEKLRRMLAENSQKGKSKCPRWISSKRENVCHHCKKRIRMGDKIVWDVKKPNIAFCENCWEFCLEE